MSKPETRPLRLTFAKGETLHTIDRATLGKIALALGFSEQEAVHYALARLRDATLPAYPTDAPDPSAAALRKSRAANRRRAANFNPTSSLF